MHLNFFVTFDFEQVAQIPDPVMNLRLKIFVVSSILFCLEKLVSFVLFKAPKDNAYQNIFEFNYWSTRN